MDKGDLDPPVITSLVRKIVDNVEFLTFLLFTSPIFTHSNFHPPNCIPHLTFATFILASFIFILQH